MEERLRTFGNFVNSTAAGDGLGPLVMGNCPERQRSKMSYSVWECTFWSHALNGSTKKVWRTWRDWKIPALPPKMNGDLLSLSLLLKEGHVS